MKINIKCPLCMVPSESLFTVRSIITSYDYFCLKLTGILNDNLYIFDCWIIHFALVVNNFCLEFHKLMVLKLNHTRLLMQIKEANSESIRFTIWCIRMNIFEFSINCLNRRTSQWLINESYKFWYFHTNIPFGKMQCLKYWCNAYAERFTYSKTDKLQNVFIYLRIW